MYYCSFCSEKLKHDSCKKTQLKKKVKTSKIFTLYSLSKILYLYDICEIHIHQVRLWSSTWTHRDASIRCQLPSWMVTWGYSTRPTPDPTSHRKFTFPLRISKARKSTWDTERTNTSSCLQKPWTEGAPLDTDKQNQDRWRDTGSEVEDEVTVDDRYCVQPQRGAVCEDGF